MVPLTQEESKNKKLLVLTIRGGPRVPYIPIYPHIFLHIPIEWDRQRTWQLQLLLKGAVPMSCIWKAVRGKDFYELPRRARCKHHLKIITISLHMQVALYINTCTPREAPYIDVFIQRP